MTATTKQGKNIKSIRESKIMSQGDICRAIGSGCAQMNYTEANNDNPTLATIKKIAQTLGVQR